MDTEKKPDALLENSESMSHFLESVENKVAAILSYTRDTDKYLAELKHSLTVFETILGSITNIQRQLDYQSQSLDQNSTFWNLKNSA